jgi:phosphoinositide-3-kinase, regulatory subunit 4
MSVHAAHSSVYAADGPALVILALICANVRSCRLPSSKLKAMDIFLALCPHLTDEAKLDRMLPCLVDLLHDDSANVRAAALRTLVQIVRIVYATTTHVSHAMIYRLCSSLS